MIDDQACFLASNEQILIKKLQQLLSDPTELKRLQTNAKDFAKNKQGVIDTVMQDLTPFLENALSS